jgi:hypothetical protein
MITKNIPLHSLVLLIGEFERNWLESHFDLNEIVDINAMRETIAGDQFRRDLDSHVWQEIYHLVKLKLRLGSRVIFNGSGLDDRTRRRICQIGQQSFVPVFYIVNGKIREDDTALWESQRKDIMRGDGTAQVVNLQEGIEVAAIIRPPMEDLQDWIWTRGFKGVTVVPDVHGMREELLAAVDWAQSRGHYLIFLGDIVDYGPMSLEVVEIVYDLVVRGKAAFIMGNHERKLQKWVEQNAQGNVRIRLSESNRATVDRIIALEPNSRARWEAKFNALCYQGRNHLVVGDFLFTHGAASPTMWDTYTNRLSGEDEGLAFFGMIDDSDPQRKDGYPNRIYTWVDDIPQGRTVIVGHDIRDRDFPFRHKAPQGGEGIFLDTGSGKGGSLTTADLIFVDATLKINNFTRH